MNEHTRAGKVASDGYPGTPTGLVEHEVVMVITQAEAGAPMLPVKAVLHEGGGLEVGATIAKGEILCSPRIKERRIRDGILQSLVHGIENRIDSELPILRGRVSRPEWRDRNLA